MSTGMMVGRYKLVNFLQPGQTSQVWEALEESTGRRFAIKMLLPDRARDKEHRHYLKHEAEVGMQLSHPKCIKIFDYHEDQLSPFFAMEFFPSVNMRLRILRKEDLLKAHAHKLIEQAAGALAHMHDKGWVHRDVKPDNLLINQTGDLRLIDFALALNIKGQWRRWLGKKTPVQGTRTYMSPEQIRGVWPDPGADIYSFGVTIYELAAGRPPFIATTPNELLAKHLTVTPPAPTGFNPKITPEFSTLVLRMLAKKRETRMGSLHEFLAEFRKIKVFVNEAEAPAAGRG